MSTTQSVPGRVSQFWQRVFQPLRERNYRLFWIGSTVSLMGDNFQIIVLPVVVMNLTGRPSGWAMVLAVLSIPRTLFMLMGGVVIDNLRPRRVMIWTNLLLAAEVGILGALVATNSIAMWLVYVCSLVYGFLSAFSFPASQAIVPELVPLDQVRTANALTTMTGNIIKFCIPLVAGVLVAWKGQALAFLINAATFLFAASMLIPVKSPPGLARPIEKPLHQLRSGLRAARSDRAIWTILWTATVFFTGYGGASIVGIPALVKLTFHSGDNGMGIFYGFLGAGSLFGSLVMGAVSRLRRQGLLISLGMVGTGLILAAVGFASSLTHVLPFAFLLGGLGSATTVLLYSFVQTRALPELRGRVIALLSLGMFGLYPLTYSVAGVVGDIFGIRSIIVFGGILEIIAGGLGLLSRTLRAADNEVATE